MNELLKPKKLKRRLKNYDFSPSARRNLAGLKQFTGWTEKAVLEKLLQKANANRAFIVSREMGIVL
jgi:hypothetical protein